MTEAGRYRTRRIEVDAIRFLGEQNCEEVHAFLGIEHPDDLLADLSQALMTNE